MIRSFKAHIRNLMVFTIIIGIISYVLTFILPENYITPTLPYLIIFFFSVNLIVHSMLRKAEVKKSRRFISNYMLATFSRFFLYLIVILAYAFINRSDAVPFIVTFFIFYVIFSVFEVITILPRS